MVSKFLNELGLTEQSFKIIEDSGVMQEVITMIKESREILVLVSPYNSYHINLKHPIEAVAQKVKIIAVCREDQQGKEGSHLEWLSNEIGADVYLVERLHAKIYCNESTAIITSMNLSESSANNSKEIGVRIKDATKIGEIHRYVEEGLIKHSTQITARPKSPAAPQQAQPPISIPEPTRGTAKPSSTPAPKAKPPKIPTRGLCIRGGEEIPYNPELPLCPKHLRSWNRYHNRDYVEEYCHRCGKERKTSFAKPLCTSCYQAAGSPT